MKRYNIYNTLRLLAVLMFFSLHAPALAEPQEYATEHCADYSLERLTRQDNVDEMDLHDQYDLIDKFFTECMAKERSELRREAAFSLQPAFFN